MDYNSIKKARYDQVWDAIEKKNLGADIYPEEAKLRIAADIVAGKGQYIFKLTRNDAQANNVSDFTLQDNDIFVPNAMGVMIGITETATGVQKLYPYAPKRPAAGDSVYAAGFESDTIEKLYNGHLTWKMGTQILLNQYPMEKFKKVPRQQGAFVLDSNDAAVSEQIQPEWSIDKCLELLMPKYTIAGNRDHYITVNFDAASLSFPVTTGYTAQIVLFLDGFLVKGGCTTIDGKNAFGDAPARFA